jgi:AmmeMemoRadiSam system protein B
MKTHYNPQLRRDLEFFPVQQGGQPLILIRDSLGLVQDGKALPVPLYEIMTLLDGTHSVRDLQMVLMRQRGGILVETGEVEKLLAHLDESFLLQSDRYEKARGEIVARFAKQTTRPCSLCGRSYPARPGDLKAALDEILNAEPSAPEPEGKVTAVVAPHIDLSVGAQVYASAYHWVKHTSPSRILLLGVGHQMTQDLFCLTEKDFETPLGKVKNHRTCVKRLKRAGPSVVSPGDFAHKSEHSLDFQLIFLQHLLAERSFTIIPILCGPLGPGLPEYSRRAYLETAGAFLETLADIVNEAGHETLVVAGVDLSHIGPKFGHDLPATSIQNRSQAHDQRLLEALSQGEKDRFWEESLAVSDGFNVCGFSAMACLLEILPPSQGQILNYRLWHEEPTRSAVSFAAVGFTKDPV